MKPIRKLLIASLLILIIVFITIGFVIYNYSSITSDETADAVIILGAAVWNGEPSPVFEERINHAIVLFKENRVKYLIFTGGVGIRDEKSEAEVGKEYAIHNGVPSDHIFTDSESRITYQNLFNAKSIGADLGISSFLIVSDPLHMKRAIIMAEDLGMTVYPSPTPTSKYESWKTKLPFLIREIYFIIHYHVRTTFGIWNY